MNKKNIFLTLLIIATIFILTDACSAAGLDLQKNNVLDRVHDAYKVASATYANVLQGYANSLFFWLVLIDLLYHLIMFWKDGGAGLDSWIFMMLFRILYAGIFLLILNLGGAIVNFIYTTVVNDMASKIMTAGAGSSAWAATVTAKAPSDLLDTGFSLCFALIKQASLLSVSGIVASIIAMCLLVVFSVIVGTIVVAMVQYYVVASLGYFYLAFGGFKMTRDITINYFKTLLGQSFTILAMYGVFSIFTGFVSTVLATDADINAAVNDIQQCAALLAGAIVFWMIMKSVPPMVGGIVSGGSFNSGGAAGAGGMMAKAAGGMMKAAAVMAGASVALGAAMELAKEQGSSSGGGEGSGLDAGGGGSTTGAGGGPEGSPQNLSSNGGGSGMVGRTIKNLASAAASTAIRKGPLGQNTFANTAGTMVKDLNTKTEASKASKKVNDAGTDTYTPPTQEDVENTIREA